MSFPTAKVHRVNRKKLGRNQYPRAAPVAFTPVPSGSTVTLLFTGSVVITGNVPFTVAGKTFVSQTINSPTSVTITFSGAVTGDAWSMPTPETAIKSYQGGPVLGASGTF